MVEVLYWELVVWECYLQPQSPEIMAWGMVLAGAEIWRLERPDFPAAMGPQV
jgi:hypothetical protein